MIFHRLLCAMAIISCAWAWIPYNDIEFDLLDGFPKTVHNQVQQLVQTTKHFFLRNDIDCVTEGGSTKVVNYRVYLMQIMSVISVVQNAIGSEYEWKRTMYKMIPDSVRRSTAENYIRELDGEIRNIAYSLGNLDPNKNLTAETKAAIVQNIHDTLNSIVMKFSNRQSIFRKHPLLAMPMVLAISSLIALFIPVETALAPELERNALVSCKLYETLIEYRGLAVVSRMHKLEIVDSTGAPIHKRNPINQVQSKAFNEYGYNQTNDASVACRRGCRPTDGEHVYVCLRDPLSGTEYDCGKRFEMYSCLFSYMEFVRHRVESVFTDPIKLLLKGCSIEARNRPRITKTGYGWWEIFFLDAAAIEDANGHSCDDFDDCDAYIKVYIDGREVYRSDTKYNNHLPYFGETYKSPKMLKAAKIKIEMYDEDGGWTGLLQSTDDLILRWDTTIDNLLENGIHWSGNGNVWRNKIVSSSTWKDEYPDWELQQFLSTHDGFREVVPAVYYSEA